MADHAESSTLAPVTTSPGAARPRIPSAILDPIAASAARPPKRRGRLLVVLASAWLVLMAVFAVTAPILPIEPYEKPLSTDLKDPHPPREKPGFRLDEPLGTDQASRSNLSRVIYGAQVSLAVGVLSVLIGLTVGGLIGLAAGFMRGPVETVTNIMIDSALAFPPLILLLTITSVLTQSIGTLVVALAVLSTPTFARLARANTLVFAQREFVLAARALGARTRRVLFREVLPNVLFPVASYAFIVMASVIVAEGSLSYLNLGIPPPHPSWGGMIASGRTALSDSPHIVFVPAVFLLLTVFSFNTLGDRARRRYDIRDSALK